MVAGSRVGRATARDLRSHQKHLCFAETKRSASRFLFPLFFAHFSASELNGKASATVQASELVRVFPSAAAQSCFERTAAAVTKKLV